MLGVGDTVKRAIALEGLAQPTTNQITNATEMFKLLSETLRTTVVFLFVSTAEVEKATARLKRRLSRAVPVKGALGTASRRSTLIRCRCRGCRGGQGAWSGCTAVKRLQNVNKSLVRAQ